MDAELEWAGEGALYLRRVRQSLHAEFGMAMESFKGTENRGQAWFHEGKSCISTIYHYSEEFAPDTSVPGASFSSPEHFSQRLDEYDAFVSSMVFSMEKTLQVFVGSDKSAPSEALNLLDLLNRLRSAIAFVRKRAPRSLGLATDDVRTVVERAARQFHEAVVSLRKHPNGATPLPISNEWDCQYLFRAILSSLIHDVRIEEWSPSVAGSSSRSEFLLKSHRIMVGLKYARRKSDGKKFKSELLTDLKDYSQHPDVDVVVVLIYDPNQVLDSAVQLQKDLSGPTHELSDVVVVISPPRSVHGI